MTKQATGKSKPWGIVNGFVIPREDGLIYLTRWGARTPFGGFYVHRMTGPDERPYPHDHPWAFTSLILKGGYDEVRINKHDTHQSLQLRRHRRWTFNVMRRDDAHYIRDLLSVPTWTLVLFGRRRRTWGFWQKSSAEGRWIWTEFDKTPYEKQRLERADLRAMPDVVDHMADVARNPRRDPPQIRRLRGR